MAVIYLWCLVKGTQDFILSNKVILVCIESSYSKTVHNRITKIVSIGTIMYHHVIKKSTYSKKFLFTFVKFSTYATEIAQSTLWFHMLSTYVPYTLREPL